MEAVKERNLNEATFEEKRNLISMLGIKIYPSEDLKTVRIKGGINMKIDNTGECGKIFSGGVGVTIGRTFELAFSLTI